MTKENIKDAVSRLLVSCFPFSLIAQTNTHNFIILYYHIVTDEDRLHVKHLYGYKGIRQFSDDLEFLLTRYSPVCLQDVIDWAKGGNRNLRNCFLLTFDDGFREVYDVIAPILTAKGIPATFFLPSAFLDNGELCYLHKKSLLLEGISGKISGASEKQIAQLLAEAGIYSCRAAEGIMEIDYGRRAHLDRIADVLMIDFREYLRREQPYVTSEQVRQLIARGFTIGAHSIDHAKGDRR